MADAPVPIPRRLLFAALTTALLLGGLEAGLRLAGYARGVAIAEDPATGYRLVPDQDCETDQGDRVRVNALGLRDEEFPREKPAGEYRVLLLGDSVTFGVGVGQDRIFPRLLDERLDARCGEGRVRVMNGAVMGYDSTQERDWLRVYGFDLQPDAVVVMFFHNDIWFDPRRPSAAQFPGRDALRRTATFRWMEDLYRRREASRMGRDGSLDELKADQFERLKDRYIGKVPLDPSASEESRHTILAREILKEMTAMCRERGVRFAVCAIPAFHNTEDPKLPHVQGALFYDLKQLGIRHHYLIDALKDHHPGCWLPYDEGHLSEEGHRLVAEAMEQWLVETKLVPCP